MKPVVIFSLQVHVGEYGVHWNFFFTLAAISILTSIINVPPLYSGILGALILVGILTFVVVYFYFIDTIFPNFFLFLGGLFVFFFKFLGYQVCLMHGLNVYLLSNERGTDIISQNKEGIFSILGRLLGLCNVVLHTFLSGLFKWIYTVALMKQ